MCSISFFNGWVGCPSIFCEIPGDRKNELKLCTNMFDKAVPILSPEMFSDEDEEIICALILSFSSRGSALTRGILIELIKKTFELDDDWREIGWFRRFVDRHSDLITMTMGKSLDPQRISKVTKEHVDKFINSFEKVTTSSMNLRANFKTIIPLKL